MTPDNSPEKKNETAKNGLKVWAWIGLVLTLLAWVALIWLNGYVALAVGVCAAVSSFVGARAGEVGIRRLAITAIIGSLVLIVVLAAFLIVLKIGMA